MIIIFKHIKFKKCRLMAKFNIARWLDLDLGNDKTQTST